MRPRSRAIRRPDRRSMMATELHAGQQVGAALAARPAAPEIAIEWLLRLIPEAEAKLYGVWTELNPAPRAEAPNLARRQIKMAKLAALAGLSRRWVIELLPRLEKRDLIRTQGGRGAAKWIWLLPLGVPRLGKPFPTELTQKEKTSPEPIPGKAKAQQAAAAQPKRRCQETAQSAKPGASVQVAPPVEKPAEIPKRRQKLPLPSTPPTDRSSGGSVLAPKVTPPAPTAPGNPAVPAAMVMPPPSIAPAKAVQATKVTPPPAPAAPVVQTAVVPPTAPGNPAVPATRVTPPPATAPASRAAQAAKVILPPPAAPGDPAVPATRVTPPPSPTPAGRAVPATRAIPPTAPAARAVQTAVVAPPTAPGNPAVPAARRS